MAAQSVKKWPEYDTIGPKTRDIGKNEGFLTKIYEKSVKNSGVCVFNFRVGKMGMTGLY